MELILIIAGLLLLDLLAMRYGIDTRSLEWRDRTALAELRAMAAVDWTQRPMLLRARRRPLRVRLARALRHLAVAIEPSTASRPA